MHYDFLKRFQQMTEALKHNPSIHILELTFHEPASSDQIEDAKTFACGTLPEGLEAFYREMNGFTLVWDSTGIEVARNMDSSPSSVSSLDPIGNIHILPVQKTFSDWKGSIWWDDWEGGDLFKPVHPFDHFVPEACATFYLPEGKPPENSLYYHYCGEELYNTGYTFVEYIERLLAARGYWYWVETLCEESCESAQSTVFFNDMPRLFADFQSELFCPGRAE